MKMMATEGYQCIDAALANIHSENATSSVPADLSAIRALVTSTPGGFAKLDSTVKGHLHDWFEARGTVRSSRRVPSMSTPRKTSIYDDVSAETKSWSARPAWMSFDRNRRQATHDNHGSTELPAASFKYNNDVYEDDDFEDTTSLLRKETSL